MDKDFSEDLTDSLTLGIKGKLERKLFTEHLICISHFPRYFFSFNSNEVHLVDVEAEAQSS